MDKKRERYTVNVILFALSALLFGIVLSRALLLSITHDEAYTYLHYLRGSWRDIFLYAGPPIPNNHLLNTLLAKLSVQWFGLSAFTLRLPNVIFSLGFFWNAAWLAKNIRIPWAQVAVFLLFSLQIFYFDFFSLARGYGMALTLLMAATYHFYMYRKLQNGHHLYRSLIFAAFAVYANFTFLYPYLALLILLNLSAWSDGIRNWKTWWIINRAVLVVSAILALFIYVPLRRIQGNLFGGADSFWNSTVESLSWSLLYGQNPEWQVLVQGIVVLTVVTALIFWARDLFIRPVEKHYFYQEALLWLFLSIFLQYVQHQLLGTPYLMGRTAIMYPLLFTSLLVFLLERLQDEPQGRFWKLGLLGLCSALVLLNFASKINFSHTSEWRYDQYDQEIFATIDRHRESENLQEVSIGASFLYEPSLNFYRLQKEADWLQPVERGVLDQKHQYYLIHAPSEPNYQEQFEQNDWLLLQHFPSGAQLYFRPSDQS